VKNLCLTLTLASSLAAATLESSLAKMDANASSFQGMTASIKRTQHTAIINDDAREAGKIAMKRSKGKVAVVINFTEPEPRAFSYRDKRAEVYLPKINTLQIYDTGKYDTALTQGLLIGFGSSSKELAANYDIKFIGDEKIGTHLELTPKLASTREQIKKIEMWLDPTDGYPRQVKIHQPSNDYMLIEYSDLKMNPSLTDEQVRVNAPKNAKKEYPLK
jgi:outer membrane lipoprotein-sorting protein